MFNCCNHARNESCVCGCHEVIQYFGMLANWGIDYSLLDTTCLIEGEVLDLKGKFYFTIAPLERMARERLIKGVALQCHEMNYPFDAQQKVDQAFADGRLKYVKVKFQFES